MRLYYFQKFVIVLMLSCRFLSAETPVLTKAEISAGSRGLALSLEADGPFQARFLPVDGNDGIHGSIISIRLTDVIYGINEYVFDNFPKNFAVQNFSAVSKNHQVDITLKTRLIPGDKITSRQKGNRWIALLSKDAFPKYTWSAAGGIKSPAVESGNVKKQPSKTGTVGVSVKDISIVQRGQAEEVIVETDGPCTIKAKRKESEILVVVENAGSDLPGNMFVPEIKSAVRKIDVKKRRVGDIDIVGISIDLDLPKNAVPFNSILPDRYVLFIPYHGSPRLAIWSAKKGSRLSYDFEDVALQNIDYNDMEKMAKEEIDEELSSNKIFTVKEGGAFREEVKKAETADVGKDNGEAARPGLPDDMEIRSGRMGTSRLVVMRDRVNLRSEPSTETPDNVIMTLSRGTKGTLLELKRDWRRIKLDDETVGWIHGNMVSDSSEIPGSVIKDIAGSGASGEGEEPKGSLEGKETISSLEQPELEQSDQTEKAAEGPGDAALPVEAPQNKKIRTKTIQYTKYGRDPFLPITTDDMAKTGLADIENVSLVGILFDENDRVALLEDNINTGNAFALRERDPVLKGKVLKIQKDKVVFLLSDMGISHTFTLKLEKTNE